MITTKSFDIASCDDFELGIRRQNLLRYTISFPSNISEIKGILFIIPGFGEDANSDYMESLRVSIAKEYSLAVVNVFYHCFYNRPNLGARLYFDDKDISVLKEISHFYEIDFSSLPDITEETVLDHLNKCFEIYKATGKMKIDEKVMIPMSIMAKNNEYQNFGIMQAVDLLNVLIHAKKVLINDDLKPIPTIFLGSSHGGYLAYLAAKIAPGQIDYVIDNSAYVKPPLKYILGKEIDINDSEFFVSHNHLVLNCFLQTFWTTDKQSPFYFSNDHYNIRDLTYDPHLNLIHPKTNYIAYHSVSDGIASATDKKEFFDLLNQTGHQTNLHLIESPSQIDGKFIKSLDHAMGMSIKGLIHREIPNILNKKSFKRNYSSPLKQIIYPGESIHYTFTMTPNCVDTKISKTLR